MEKYRGYSFLLPPQKEGEESRVVKMDFNQNKIGKSHAKDLGSLSGKVVNY
jgi:hypothetical protein